MAKFTKLFLKESKQIQEVEFTPPGKKEVDNPAPTVDHSKAPPAELVGHKEHPAPSLKEPESVGKTVPAGKATTDNPSKLTEAQVDALIETLTALKESFASAK